MDMVNKTMVNPIKVRPDFNKFEPQESDLQFNKISKEDYDYAILKENYHPDSLDYKFIKDDLGNKYKITISQDHTYKENEGTMPRVKQLLNRYNISYREI